MTISDVIRQLEEIRRERGDLEVLARVSFHDTTDIPDELAWDEPSIELGKYPHPKASTCCVRICSA